MQEGHLWGALGPRSTGTVQNAEGIGIIHFWARERGLTAEGVVKKYGNLLRCRSITSGVWVLQRSSRGTTSLFLSTILEFILAPFGFIEIRSIKP